MVAGIAHEINTPLGISVTAASHLHDEARRLSRLLASGELTRSALDRFESTVRDSTAIVLRNLQRADRLIRSFKQVAVDQSSEERRVVDLGKSLDEIITTLGPSLKSSACRIQLNCPQLIIVEIAPGALYQIIANLVMNSLTHGFAPGTAGGLSRPCMASGAAGLLPDGLSRPSMASEALGLLPGGLSRPSMASEALGLLPGVPGLLPNEIRIDVRRDEVAVRIDYADNGQGMDESVRRRIFEPFFTTRRGQGGSGLGMHIVYNLVTQGLQGSIECISARGEGALFRIALPAPPP
jgi:signal transduction histidine kinase